MHNSIGILASVMKFSDQIYNLKHLMFATDYSLVPTAP